MAEAHHHCRLRARHGCADQHHAPRGRGRAPPSRHRTRLSAITVSVDLDAPVERVWEILEPIERHVEWMADAVAIRFTGDQRTGVGTTFDCDTKVGPLQLVDRMEITEWEPPTTMGVRHRGVVTGTGRFTLAPIDLDRRTRFTWSEDLHFPWWLAGRLGELLGGRVVMRAIWRRNLRALDRLVTATTDAAITTAP